MQRVRWLASRAPLALLGWAKAGSSLLAQQGAKSCPGRHGGHHLVSRQEKSRVAPAGDQGGGGRVRNASLLQARAQTPALLLLLMPVRHSLLLTDPFLGDLSLALAHPCPQPQHSTYFGGSPQGSWKGLEQDWPWVSVMRGREVGPPWASTERRFPLGTGSPRLQGAL